MTHSRRKFIRTSSAAAGALAFPTIIPSHVLGGPNHTPPSEKALIGMVGVGGQGRHNARLVMQCENAQIIAIADPAEYWDLHDFYYRNFAGRGPVKEWIEDHYESRTANYRVAEFEDFRDMLEEVPELDAVVCSTPDHLHAYVTANAMRAGKHVYCEKPLTHNIWENRKILKLTRETGLATQMGNFGHSTEGIRRTVEFLRGGVIGEVKEAASWGFATRWNPGLNTFPAPADPMPGGLNWDLWLGNRDYVPFSKTIAPVRWRDFWTFGTGALGDFGCHDMDAAVWAFNLKAPSEVQVFPGGDPKTGGHPGIAPYSEIGYYKFPARGDQKALDLTWYSGSLRPPHHPWLPENFTLSDRGVMFIGDKGLIQADGSGGAPRVFPRERRAVAADIEKSLPRSNGHMQDWIDAIQGGPIPSANFEYSALLNEIVLLGVLSLRLKGERIFWDYDRMEATGQPEAEPLINVPARRGWEI